MPPSGTDDGLRLAIAIRREHPATAVAVLTQFVGERYPLELIGDNAEGVGYLLKQRVADAASFVASVRRVAAGGSALDPEVVALMVARRRRDNAVDTLSGREREVLTLMAQGLSSHGIAQELDVTSAAIGSTSRTCSTPRSRAATASPRDRRADPSCGPPDPTDRIDSSTRSRMPLPTGLVTVSAPSSGHAIPNPHRPLRRLRCEVCLDGRNLLRQQLHESVDEPWVGAFHDAKLA